MADRKPRLVELRYLFQTIPPEGEASHTQFAVRAVLCHGKLDLTFDIHGPGDGVENLTSDVAVAIVAAIEQVRASVNPKELSEEE